MRRLLLLVLLVMTVVPSTAAAAPGVVQDLPGCTTALDPNDDGSTDEVPLGFTADMFDTSFDSVFVNNNGNVTVGAELSKFTPFDFRETGDAMIAPFFADVDTSGDGSGTVHYGQVTGGYGGPTHPAFCVTWDGVGYYDEHDDKLNTFQLIIVKQTDGIDLVFNYDSITWETGDLSGGHNGLGGTSAVAGYASGDGDAAHALMLPGSFANGGFLDANAATSLAGHGTTGQPAGRYIFQLRHGAPTGAKLTGTITVPGGDPAGGALVQICRTGGGCITRTASSSGIYTASNLAAGTYTVLAFPGPGPAYASARADNVVLGAPGTTHTEDLELGDLPDPPPPGTSITSIDTTPAGLPVAYWDDPLTLTTEGCTGATATYQIVLEGHVVRSGSMTETSTGHYRAVIAPLSPNTGDGVVSIHLDCPASTDEDTVFGIYIDPSGTIRDERGRPVSGAVVTLQRSAAAAGPFFAVPAGSAIMSPANRTNPDVTGADGRFGWDVVAGYYKVTASKAGCTGAKTTVLSIPPPVTNLDLRLNCAPKTSPPPPQPPLGPLQLAKVGKVKLRSVRALLVAIACAPTANTGCAGKVTVKLGRKAIGSKRYKGIKPGKTARVKVALTKRGRARLAKLRHGKKVKLRVTATVRDAAGVGVTATRTVTVRRP
jgi:hypothetical protein